MGRRIALSNGRRLVDDTIHFARKIPLGNYCRELDLSRVARMRRQSSPRIGWNVLMMKAYALIAQDNEILRSCYVRFPWPHIYVDERNVCLLTVSREHQGETRLLFARFNEPENISLIDLQEQYDHLRLAPVDEIKQFKHQIQFARLPHSMRRLIWWGMFNWFPRKRLGNFGTYGMTLSGFGPTHATGLLSPATTTLGVDPISRKGISRVVLTFDHRVMDGKPVIDLIDQLKQTLNEQIYDELAASVPPTRQLEDTVEKVA